MYVCKLCMLPLQRLDLLPRHLHRIHHLSTFSSVSPPDLESYCNKVNLSDVISRIQVAATPRQMWRYCCRLCEAQFRSRAKILSHICVNKEGALSCFMQCPDGQVFPKYHSRTCFTDAKLCHLCGASFSSAQQLQGHVDSGCRLDKRRFRCKMEGCTYSSTTNRCLKHHLQTVHLKITTRQHVCDQCGAAYMSRNNLRNHTMSSHLREEKFYCNHCPKFFYSRQLVRRHFQRAHKYKAILRCRFCGQGFGTRFNLAIHENIHTGLKPYQCQQCEEAFAQKNSLDVHMKKHKKIGSAAISGVTA